MTDIFVKIRWNINFIEEETSKVGGSLEVKNEIIAVCRDISVHLSKVGEKDDVEIVENIKKELNRFDEIITKIETDNDNNMLFMLLICHIPDIRILFLSKEEQERIFEKIK